MDRTKCYKRNIVWAPGKEMCKKEHFIIHLILYACFVEQLYRNLDITFVPNKQAKGNDKKKA